MTKAQAKVWQKRLAKLDAYEIDPEAQYTLAQYAEMMETCESAIAELCVGWTRQELIDRVNTDIANMQRSVTTK